MMRKIRWMVLATVLFCMLFSAAYAEDFSDNPDEIENKALSVLMLEIYDDGEEIATGSGFVMFDNMTLVTNYHVIEDATMIVADSDDGYQYFITKVLIADEKKDIAILQFMTPTVMQPLTPSEKTPRRGENVVAIGSPIGLKNTVSMGNVSSVYTEDDVSWIQFTAAISHGSSGGALFNDDGEVIGITSAFWEDGQNLNLAIDIREAVALYEKWTGTKYDIEDYEKANISQPQPTDTPKVTPRPTQKPTPTPTPTKKPTAKPTATKKPTAKPTATPQPTVKIISFTQTDDFYRIRTNKEKNIADITNVMPGKASLDSVNWTVVYWNTDWKNRDAGENGTKNVAVVQTFSTLANILGMPQCRINSGKISFNTPGVYMLSADTTFMTKSAQALFIVEPEDGVTLFFEDENAYASWDYVAYDKLSIKFQVSNSFLGKTIKYFELWVYPVDAQGQRLCNDNKVYYCITTATIEAGGQIYSNKINLPNGTAISKVYCGIHKVIYTDGTSATVDKVEYFCWKIK